MQHTINFGQREINIERYRWIGIILINCTPTSRASNMRKGGKGVIGRMILDQIYKYIVVDSQIPPVAKRQEKHAQHQRERSYHPEETTTSCANKGGRLRKLGVKGLWHI